LPQCDEKRCIAVLSAGRVALPASLLTALDVKKGDLVTISSIDGGLVIEKFNRFAIVRSGTTGEPEPAAVGRGPVAMAAMKPNRGGPTCIGAQQQSHGTGHVGTVAGPASGHDAQEGRARLRVIRGGGRQRLRPPRRGPRGGLRVLGRRQGR